MEGTGANNYSVSQKDKVLTRELVSKFEGYSTAWACLLKASEYLISQGHEGPEVRYVITASWLEALREVK